MLALTPDEIAFRDEVRRFFAEDYPEAVIAKLANGDRLEKSDHVASQCALNARGWLGVGWPREHGGPGWTPIERYVFDQELELAGAAAIIPMAVIYIGPIICAFGTPEQKARWLPDILESRSFWAQGYSEPEAGSDLASLRFAAVRDGDEYVLNGTKIWTSGAHMADWIFCLARTSKEERKQQGISLICAPLDLPGITVHPIELIDGSHELSRVEFVDVRVPAANRIGEEGQAWHYANVLLKTERLSYAHVGAKRRDLAKARALAHTVPAGRGTAMADDPDFARGAASVEAQLAAIESAVVAALRSEPTMPATAALKIACTECAQAITELFVRLAGRNRAPLLERHGIHWAKAAPAVPRFALVAIQSYFFERAQTIYGGSTEIQKNIIWRWLRGVDGPAAREENPAESEQQRLLRQATRTALARLQESSEGRVGLAKRLDLLKGVLKPRDAAVVMEEAGRALLRERLAEALLARWLLERIDGDRASDLGQALSRGALNTAYVWAEPDTRYDLDDVALRVVRQDGGWRLDGTKTAASFGPESDHLIVLARVEGDPALFAVAAKTHGVTLYAYPTIDNRGAADIVFDGVRVNDEDCLAIGSQVADLVDEYRDRAIALQTAEAVGLLDALVEQTVSYTAQRRQFGQPIAEFQALQHRMVDMFRESELARAAARLVAEALETGSADRSRAASVAQAIAARACRHVSQEAVQLHGGMGMTAELPLSGYVRRATMIAGEWGDRDWHLRRLAALARDN